MEILEQSYRATPGSGTGSSQMALREPEETKADGEFTMFGDDGFDFFDVLDVVNPLQHIPFVSTMYRETTGDTLAAAPRVVGATLFFGPLGLVSSLANVFIEEQTGQDIGAHVADWVLPDDGTQGSGGEDTAIASLTSATTDEVDAKTSDAVDIVSDWARKEIAWAQASVSPSASNTPVPDATPFLTEPGDIASIMPTVIADNHRAASWAYEAAAGLDRAG